MNNWVLRFISLAVLMIVLVGCASGENSEEGTGANDTAEQTEQSQSSEQNEKTVAITISRDNGEEVITEEEIVIEEDAILMDVMEENFELEVDEGFINSINGVAPDANEEKFWAILVNEEKASVGAEELELTPGDNVTFDLQAWE